MIKTNRCLLSKLQEDDYEDVKLLYVDESVRKYLGGTLKEETIQVRFNEMNLSSKDSTYFVVRENDTNRFIGLISLDTHYDGVSTEVSYQLLPKWWGEGYATEIVKEIIYYAFHKLNLTEIVAETQLANKSSCRLLEKVGMKLRETVQRFGEEQAIYCIKNS
ncbi:N-acetyltransferase [Bacillus sp. C1-1]|nr:N-acetyltransferase [Bacillus sp. C1-1]